MWFTTMLFVIGIFALGFAFGYLLNMAYGAEDEWAGKPKWNGEAHDDNKPTEKDFWKTAEKKKLHSLSKCIDMMECKNNDVDFDKFKETKAWTNATEEEKICIVESEDLGNKLQDYEIEFCYKNPDYYYDR